MKAVVLPAPGSCAVKEMERPSPAEGEVLLEIQAIGLCGSDLNSFRGKNPLVSFPRIPGHEISARIAALGPGVPAEWREGMAVTASPYTACGECPSCRRGRENACRNNQTLGVQRDGAMREWLVLPWQKLRRAEGLSYRELCLVEPLSVGFHAVDRGRVTAEDTVAVLGCGGVGLAAVAASAHRGAMTIAVDVDDAKLALARKAGAAHTINSRIEDLHTALAALTNGDGPDVVVEAIGLPETFRAAVEEVAFTGRVVYIGYAKAPVEYETRLFVQKELDILGSRNATPKDFDAVIEVLRSGLFPVEEMVSRVVPMEAVGEALRAWEENPAAISKILVEVQPGSLAVPNGN